MKTHIRNTTLMVLLMVIGMNAEAQFLKKLGERAENAAERAVMNRTEREAAKKTDQTLDKVLNMDFGSMVGQPADASILPESYEFDWRYTMKMSHAKGDIKMHYFLSEKGGAFASRPETQQGTTPMGNMLMVMDPSLSTTTILLDNQGSKTGTVMSNPDLAKAVSKENKTNDYEFKQIGGKDILGYACQGFQIENEDALTTMYVAFDTPVSFNNSYGGDSRQLPKGFDPKWLDRLGENSLMMEIEFQNKKKPKQSAKMTCVALEKDPMTINVSDYDFSFQRNLQSQNN